MCPPSGGPPSPCRTPPTSIPPSLSPSHCLSPISTCTASGIRSENPPDSLSTHKTKLCLEVDSQHPREKRPGKVSFLTSQCGHGLMVANQDHGCFLAAARQPARAKGKSPSPRCLRGTGLAEPPLLSSPSPRPAGHLLALRSSHVQNGSTTFSCCVNALQWPPPDVPEHTRRSVCPLPPRDALQQ